MAPDTGSGLLLIFNSGLKEFPRVAGCTAGSTNPPLKTHAGLHLVPERETGSLERDPGNHACVPCVLLSEVSCDVMKETWPTFPL